MRTQFSAINLRATPRFGSPWGIVLIGALIVGLMRCEVHAAQVSLRWDYTASGAAGFVLYCGSSSRSYSTRVDVGNTDTYSIGTLPAGATSFCAVTAYDSSKVESGYSNELSVLVPSAAPVVNFTASPTSGTAPLTVTFANTTSGQVTSWLWDFGDGTTSTAQNPSHVYSAAGSYKPVLTATGPGGSASKTAATAISVGTTAAATSTGTVSNTRALGLVAAYGFNEGSGSSVADISGNNNKGTLTSGVTWTTQGKFGNALVFNGSTGRVDIADATSLRLTGTMTLEAWVNPATVSSTWRDVIYKGNDNYYLMASSTQAGVPAGRAGANKVLGTLALPTNTWTHLAVTYGNSTLRLYVNGVLASSVAYTGSIATSTYPLQVGGDSIYGQYFQGLIDEVRVYNRALSQSEIQADMSTAVSP